MKSSKPGKSANEAALDSLSRRALTCSELETRLKNKGYADGEVKPVVAKLLEWGYLNDQELALAYCQNRLKRFSRRRVHRDLFNRGVASELIEQALEAAYSSADEYRQCSALAEQWRRQEESSWEHMNSTAETRPKIPRDLRIRQRVFRKLAQRGYSSEMIRSVLSETCGDGDGDWNWDDMEDV